MKYLFLFLFGGSCLSGSYAQIFEPQETGSMIKFVIANLGFDVNGSFKGIKGSILFDEKNLPASSFNVTVNAETVNTGIGARDKHLRGEDYFDVSNFPLIRISSVKIARSATAGYFVFFGKLTIKNQTKDISFPFTATGEANGIRFKGSFKMKRRDFNVGGRSTVSNDLTVFLDVFAKKD